MQIQMDKHTAFCFYIELHLEANIFVIMSENILRI